VFRGAATLSASGARVSQAPVLDAASGLMVAKIDFPEFNDQLVLSFSNTKGGVKDLRVIRPGYTLDQILGRDTANPLPVLTPKFLTHIDAFSTLRYMDFTLTNHEVTQRKWTDRATVEALRGGRSRTATLGRPWERVIEMANETNTDLWINVQTTADDDYYKNLATMLKQGVKSGLKIYVEYSNEVWNYSFNQKSWVTNFGVTEERSRGKDVCLSDSAKTFALYNAIAADGQDNELALTARVVVNRIFRISEIFRSVYKTDFDATIRPVLAWKAVGVPEIHDALIYAQGLVDTRNSNCPADAKRNIGYFLHGIAIAPYFGLGATQGVDGLGATAILDDLEVGIKGWSKGVSYEYSAYLAKKYGVKLLAYEGGPDTFGTTSVLGKADANRSSRMEALCGKYMDDWYGAGGGLFMWFNAGAASWSSNFGTWTLEEILDPAKPSPKSRCLNTKATSGTLPPVVTRHVPQVAFDAAEVAGYYATAQNNRDGINREWYSSAQERDYLISSPIAKCYKLSVKWTYTYSATAGFNVFLNGSSMPVASKDLTPRSTAVTSTTDLGQICLDAGVNVLTFKLKDSTNGNLETITYQ